MSRIAFHKVTVEFGATKALEDIEFSIEPGEIVGLLGHNGAGKSTLINVAAGVYRASGGSFEIDGQTVSDPTPAGVNALGLTVVNQEPMLVKTLSVFDNLFLGRAHIPRRERSGLAKRALARVGLEDLSLDALVGELPIGHRQLVDLARGLVGGEIRVLFLDEPTAALGAAETTRLHNLIREFSEEGTSVVYVSHRLPDILDICTRVVVLNGGRLVQDTPAADLTVGELASALAPDFVELEAAESRSVGETVLRVSGPSEMHFGKGEIVGLFGMAAGNQFKLIESIFGWQHHVATREFHYFLDGEQFEARSPASAVASGVFMSPADRDSDGLLSNLSAIENVMLPWYRKYTRLGYLGQNTGERAYETARAQLKVLGPVRSASIAAFSGGNRQKHLLARWMFPEQPRVLLLNQPTQGVDIGAKNDIVRALRLLAAQGVTIIVASSESDEIARMCGRAYVIFDTAVAEINAGPDMEEELLGSLLELAAA